MSEKTFVYIDGNNLHLTVENMGWKLDYARFRIFLRDKYKAVVAYYFIGHLDRYPNLYDGLRQDGYILVDIEPTILPNGKIKGDCDTDLICRAVNDLLLYDNAIIVTSDGDYKCLIEYWKSNCRFKRVIACSRGGCARKLRRVAGAQIDYLDDFKEKLEYKPKGNPLRTKP